MSTPEFAPALSSTLLPLYPHHHPHHHHHHHDPTTTNKLTATEPTLDPTSPTSSSSSSSSSSTSSSCANLRDSGILSSSSVTTTERDESGESADTNHPSAPSQTDHECRPVTSTRLMSADLPNTTEVDSVASTSSSSSSADERRHDYSAPMSIADLSVHENDSARSSNPRSEAAASTSATVIPGASSWNTTTITSNPPSKARRASTLSTSSSSAHLTSNDEAHPGSSSLSTASTSTSKGPRDPTRPAKRKAARTGSFDTSHHVGSSSAPSSRNEEMDANEDDGDAADTEADPPTHHKKEHHDDDSRMRDDDDADEDEEPPNRNRQSTPSNARPIPRSSTSSRRSSPRTARAPAPAPPAPAPHVDIVSYPSADLLKLLASLLEQIAHANDALHQRHASASSSKSNSGTNTPGGALGGRAEDEEANEATQAFNQGRFDAAPLNSPMTPRYRRGQDEDDEDEETYAPTNTRSGTATPAEEMPVTPGVDLLREVGAGGGAQGFMPSLGGTHAPVPLSRRRGSSFLKKRVEEPKSGPLASGSISNGSQSWSASGSGSSSGQPTLNRAGSSSASGSSTSATTPSGANGLTEAPPTSLLTASSTALSSPSATLCFHARNIPAISIEAYLLRILKYCPTTNEVFLSLLVYFDRMARVGLEAQRLGLQRPQQNGASSSSSSTTTTNEQSRLFAIDSFNVHRLVIAGVTVASKFFSDVFYTNSRYAKVGGLPLQELNQLELQFLLLNDFRLVITVEELQCYADQLILFWVGRNGQGATSNVASTPLINSPAPPAQPSSAASNSTPSLAAAQLMNSSSSNTSFPFDRSSSTAPPSRPTPTSRTYSGMHQQLTSHAIAAVGASGIESTPRTTPTTVSRIADRPVSIRSQPSSSGTSVTSTITPGTPSTERHSSEGGFDSTEGVGSSDDEEEGGAGGRRNRFDPAAGLRDPREEDSDDDRSVVASEDVVMKEEE